MKRSLPPLLFVLSALVHLEAAEKPDVIPMESWQKKYWYKPTPPKFPGAYPKAQYRSNGPIRFVTFHRADASPADETEAEEIKALGDGVWMHHARDCTFQEVAYHYLIGQSGRIYKGRPDSIAPASGESYFSSEDLAKAKYASSGRLNIEGLRRTPAPGYNQGHLTICFLVKDEAPSAKAYESATRLAAALLEEHKLEPAAIRVHREVANTSCPGDHIHKWVRGEPSAMGPTQEMRGPGLDGILKLITK